MRLNREFRQHFGEERYFEARAECLAALGVPADEIAGLNGGVSAPTSAVDVPLVGRYAEPYE